MAGADSSKVSRCTVFARVRGICCSHEIVAAHTVAALHCRFFINCLAEKAEDVAQLLVPQIRKVSQDFYKAMPLPRCLYACIICTEDSM